MEKSTIFIICFLFVIIIAILSVVVAMYFLIDLTSEDKTFNDWCIERHNYYRNKHHNTPPMKLSQELIESAERHAQELAKSNIIKETSSLAKRSNLGVNVYTERTPDGLTRTESLTCEEPISQWYSEQKRYIYGINFFTTPLTQHFTQMVWSSTKEVGCAKSYSDQYVFSVCHYRPKGNIYSKYKANVHKRFG